MNEKIQKTLKSAETEDWLDLHVVRPFCYWWAVFFAKLDIHPNTVTILSMIIGAASTFFFACGSFYYEGTNGLVMNIIAILLLCLADIFDCTDGQLARMTGKKSRLGRILDGVAGFTWFVPIYHGLVYRFYIHHDIEFAWLGIADTEQNVIIATIVVYILGIISGVAGLAGQQRLADYYIQAHLFFLKGEKGSELDNSKKQEQKTPEFQKMLKAMREKYGSLDNIPADIREDFHKSSLPVITWNGLLTFNFRSAWLFLFCLLDIPVMNFIWEIVAMGLLAWYVNHRHETFCKRIRTRIEGLK